MASSRALTSSLWARDLGGGFGPLDQSKTTEVVVVGAGIAGLLTATILEQAGHDVVVVDRDVVGGVATRNTTAKVTALQGTVMSAIASARDAATARSYAEAQVDAVDGMRALIGSLGVDCEMTPGTAISFAFGEEAVTKVSAEYDAALEAGLPVRWNAATDLPFEVAASVSLDNQFHMHPTELCRALADRLGPNRVFQHTAVKKLRQDRGMHVVTSDAGHQIRAEHFVLATQSPIFDPLLLANRCKPMQSYALAARVQGEIPASMSISADEFTVSLRPARANDETFLIIGGNGHPTGTPGTPDRWDKLEAWGREHFGAIDVAYRWATHDLVPTDRVPFVGPLTPSARGGWVATGFGKWGMTNAYAAARMIQGGIEGAEPLPWFHAFDSTRVRTTINRRFLSAASTAVQHLVVDRLALRREPRCTHQGCVLRKDTALDTWDCPCHGSRFDASGEVLQGPAIARAKTT